MKSDNSFFYSDFETHEKAYRQLRDEEEQNNQFQRLSNKVVRYSENQLSEKALLKNKLEDLQKEFKKQQKTFNDKGTNPEPPTYGMTTETQTEPENELIKLLMSSNQTQTEPEQAQIKNFVSDLIANTGKKAEQKAQAQNVLDNIINSSMSKNEKEQTIKNILNDIINTSTKSKQGQKQKLNTFEDAIKIFSQGVKEGKINPRDILKNKPKTYKVGGDKESSINLGNDFIKANKQDIINKSIKLKKKRLNNEIIKQTLKRTEQKLNKYIDKKNMNEVNNVLSDMVDVVVNTNTDFRKATKQQLFNEALKQNLIPKNKTLNDFKGKKELNDILRSKNKYSY